MSRPLKYAQLVLETWPKVRDILMLASAKPRTVEVLTPVVEAALAIVKELDGVADGKTLAKDAQARIEALTHGLGSDEWIDQMIDKKFPR